MKRLLFAGIALVALDAGSALAADLRIKQPVYKAPPPVALYDWTGFHVGGHGGWAWTEKDWFFTSGFKTVSLRADDGIGGVQGGFNWQTGRWVLGVEVDSSWGEIRKGGIKAGPH